MSWTWCIGMFLPVLLVRDFGVLGWVVFAVPNVVGAAAMGWTVRSREHSVSLVSAHHGMADVFSFITATFQVFFAIWIFPIFGPRWAAGGWVVIPAAVLGSIAIAKLPGLARWAALVVLAISCAAMVGLYQSGQSAIPQNIWFELRYDAHNHTHYSLASLGIVCLLGFAVCPYLDSTFHRARQRSRGTAPVAFGLGFGVFFFAMILFTLAYYEVLIQRYEGDTWANWLAMRAVAVHLVCQLIFTTSLHWAELEQPFRRRTIWAIAVVAGSIIIGTVLERASWLAPNVRLFNGETVYRFFMSFYGLVFPAYVWICMIPHWRSPRAPGRREWIVLGVAVLVASPFYFAAFIGGAKMIWVLPGVAIVLLARALVPWKARRETAYNPS
jgi:hypothetical protein